jgi:malonate-semialdehyde dehydrogenase (acetylating)/methylmalonate-semialdehyde dehydrogenase
MVVMPDAVLARTVEGVLGSAFGAAGQRCMAGSVVVAVGSVHDTLVEALVAAAAELRVGDGLDERSDVGPVISQEACERIGDAIERALEQGASVALDGRRAAAVADSGGSFLGPTIVTDVRPEMEMATEEIFGPVLADLHAHGPDAVEFFTRKKTVTSRFHSSGQGTGPYFVER